MSSAPSAVPLSHPAASLRRYSGEYGAHEHAHAQVLVGLRGQLQLELDGRATFVDASRGLIVPAGSRHAYFAKRLVSVVVIDAPPDAGLERVRSFAPPAAWRDSPHAVDAEALLEALAAARRLLPRRRLDLALIDEALDRSLHEPWDTSRLALLCHMSPQRFHARFVELTRQTPAAYVRQRRLDEAERLLRAGMPLESAALRTGYRSASALAFALRRERAVGARALRRAR